jgi:drug/metabolite transporter (DMT)-like permease
MPLISLAAALGASLCWAVGYLIAHRPASQLGAFEFTRTQLISSFAVLTLIVTALNGWQSVNWMYWPSFATASLIGVVCNNLAITACLRRGGPRRMQVLSSMSAPFAALLGFLFLGETMSSRKLIGIGLAFGGLLLAILFGRRSQHHTEPVQGSLAVVIALGLFAAMCSAVGLIALKPALLAGTHPLAATALRTGGGALVISVVALWPAKLFETLTKRTPRVVLHAMLPGFIGYIAAVSLQLYALRSYEAGVVAVLSAMAPIMMLPIIWIMSGDRPPWSAWIGAILAVSGASVIFTG